MIEHKPFVYGLFTDPALARRAARTVESEVDGEVSLLQETQDLTPRRIPLTHTMARAGVILGAALVAGATLIAFVALVALGFDVLADRSSSLTTTAMLVVALAALFGGLAGALSYSTRVGDELRRLRGLLRFGNAIVLVESGAPAGRRLRRAGAIEIGTIG